MAVRELLLIGLAEGDARVARAAARALGWEVRAESGLSGGLASLAARPAAATLLSLDAVGASLELAERLVAEGRVGSLLLVSREATARLAVDAMRAGAREVLVPPLEREPLESLLRSLVSEGGRVPLPDPGAAGELVGSSPELMEVFKTVGRVAPSAATVLITGESGTGKEVVAREIHAASGRARGPFVAVNCAAIPEALLESELFGHTKGAFTGATAERQGLFEEAHEGTLFLDELGDLPVPLQVKLLRALQEGEVRRVGDNAPRSVDVRLVAATARDLEADVAEGRFRADLYYRVNVVRIHLPALRERSEDIPELVRHFVDRFNRRLGVHVTGVSAAAMRALVEYPWPGNVRELENVVERAMVLTDGPQLGVEQLPTLAAPAQKTDASASPLDLSVKRRTEELERALIKEALERTRNNRTRAAKLLDLSHRALLYKIRDYGLGD